MTTNIENTPFDLPDNRCTEILQDALTGYAGIETIFFDLENGQLKAVIDPRLISKSKARKILQEVNQEATALVAHCSAKEHQGLAACARCTAAMHAPAEAATDLDSVLTGEHIQAATRPLIDQTEKITIQVDVHPAESAVPSRRGGLTPEQVEILFTVLTALFGFAGFFAGRIGLLPGIQVLLYAAAYAFGGFFGLQESLEALKEGRLNVDLLMILAAIGAAVIGQPAEGAVLLFLFSLSNTLQSYAMDRSRKAIEKLLDLRPSTALLKTGQQLKTVPIEDLRLGDRVVVRPGERFPIDGQVASGTSLVDEAPITGESMPVSKQPGDLIFAGTVNGNGSLEIEVTHLAKDTTLARIVKMVEEAQNSKASTQRMLDDFEAIYALLVLSAAALLVLVPYFGLHQPFAQVLYRAMTWLVVASPCALVISTPASFLSAIANAARHGVLFKGGVHLERAAGIKVVAFDKTGTLTKGTPQVVHLQAAEGVQEEDFLRWIAAIESRSEHPLAQAIVAAATEKGLQLPEAFQFHAWTGQGVEGRVEDRKIWIGNERLYAERGLTIPRHLLNVLAAQESAGHTAMLAYDASNGRWLGTIALADTLREDTIQMIRALKEIGIQRVVMLTGDNPRVAEKIAARAGVDEFHASLLPQDKVTLLKTLQERYGPVAMVGDGINDAPSLAAADIGIAMGAAGTDVAIETADIVLMSDDMHKIPFTIELARRARQVVWQNLTFALAVIVILVASTFGVNLPLSLGVVGHEGSTVLVVLNGLRLLAYGDKRA